MTDTPPRSYWEAIRRRVGWRDVWAVVLTALLLAMVVALKIALDEIQEGRRVGTQIACGANQAFLQTNQRTIEGAGQHFSPEQEKQIERFFGSKKEREAGARLQGRDYVARFANAIVAFVPSTAQKEARAIVVVPAPQTPKEIAEHKPVPLARIDCRQLQAISRVK